MYTLTRPGKSVHTTTSTAAPQTTTTVATHGLLCPKCGIINKNGRPSCCAPGGAWFQNCDHGDDKSTLEHTWDEGLAACEGTIAQLGCITSLPAHYIIRHQYLNANMGPFIAACSQRNNCEYDHNPQPQVFQMW